MKLRFLASSHGPTPAKNRRKFLVNFPRSAARVMAAKATQFLSPITILGRPKAGKLTLRSRPACLTLES
jgi:hypothetical protein